MNVHGFILPGGHCIFGQFFGVTGTSGCSCGGGGTKNNLFMKIAFYRSNCNLSELYLSVLIQ